MKLTMLRLIVAAAATVVAGCDGSMVGVEDETSALEPQNDPPARGIAWARGGASAKAGGGGSPNLVYHGGNVMTQGAYVEAIFWGSRWNDSSFVADKLSGVQTFYSGVGGTTYAATNSEYTDSTGAHVGTAVSFGGSHVDLSSAPRNGSRTSPILAKACSAATTLRSDGYYAVYVDTPRGHAGFCAWHSTGTCPNGTVIQFGFFFNLDGDAGCDPQDGSGLHSQGMAALANVSGHELSETVTDQHLDAWYDSTGEENSDKCAWSFGTPLLRFGNNSQWKVQGNWSNAAFNGGTGYANRDGQKGCIDGGNFK
jgi:hypothetical protein